MKKQNVKPKQEVKKEQQPPIAKFRSGAIQGTCWMNETKKDDETFENFSFTIERSYTTDNGKTFEHTNSFRKRDVANVQAVMSRIADFLLIDEDEEVDKEE